MYFQNDAIDYSTLFADRYQYRNRCRSAESCTHVNQLVRESGGLRICKPVAKHGAKAPELPEGAAAAPSVGKDATDGGCRTPGGTCSWRPLLECVDV
jgi:hypothetical protein